MAEEEELRQQTLQILEPRSRERGKLIPILQEIQASFGYLPREAMLQVAAFLSDSS